MSRKRTSLAFVWMKPRRASTSSPMSVEKISSAIAASSTVTCNSVRVAGFIVVSPSSCQSISPRPLNRLTSILRPSCSASNAASAASSFRYARSSLPSLAPYSGGCAMYTKPPCTISGAGGRRT